MIQKKNDIVITDFQEFEHVINDLKMSLGRMTDYFYNEKQMMKRIDKTDIWTGEVQEKVYLKYIGLSDCYNPVIESLSTYIKFLETAMGDYKNTINTINSSVDNNHDRLNVN